MLALAVHAPADYREAPEFEYLVSWVRSRVESVAGPVVSMPSDHLGGKGDIPALVLDCRTLLGGLSLEKMLQVLDGGARAVVPTPLAETDLISDVPVYSLRGFEDLEERFLAGSGSTAEPVEPPFPALLLAPGAIVRETTAQAILHDTSSILPGITPVRAGLCHTFVDYYGQVREDVLPLLPEGCREVLEIGCGRGATGELIQERLGCRVTGVELNPVVARSAAEVLHHVRVGDVLEVGGELAREGARFDALVAFELFEHLTEQESFLELGRQLVRPGGRIVLSVPNVGHYSVVEDLLAGRWDYLPIGLLCFTHYRFFTQRTLEDWLRRCGFDRFRLLPQRTELPERFLADPPNLTFDRESLATKGFYVVIDIGFVNRAP